MSLLAPAFLGVITGCGAFVAIRSARPPGLAGAAQRLIGTNAAATFPGAPAIGKPVPVLQRVARVAGRRTKVRPNPQQERDLAVLGRDPLGHSGAKVFSAVIWTAAALGLLAGATVLHAVASPALMLPLVAGAAIVGYILPDRRVRRDARARRVDVVAALSSYLDLVTVLLAGGAGIETALHAAAESGDGWTYEQLRAALMRARTTRQSVWSCYSELGRRTGVEELVELSASVQLAGRQGARIAQSLATRASTLRSHVLAGIEADAHAASERMGLPTVLMFIGFLFLLGFPAAQVILGSS